ncbi:hypothetical protein [Demequina phytophila]|nr:hypothetical protein [Demequina phytophila]
MIARRLVLAALVVGGGVAVAGVPAPADAVVDDASGDEIDGGCP